MILAIKALRKAPLSIVIAFISIYRYLISPILGPSCRFLPTCSDYACCAIRSHGILLGLYYSTFRILRCNPLFRPGFDPVPQVKKV